MRDLSAVQCRSIPTRPHHDVKLLPAQFVKPFLKGQKNDFRDAEAVAEAVQRPTMRFVPTKSVSSARPAGAASGAFALGQPAHRHRQPDPAPGNAR
jgi:hypothetical protein